MIATVACRRAGLATRTLATFFAGAMPTAQGSDPQTFIIAGLIGIVAVGLSLPAQAVS